MSHQNRTMPQSAPQGVQIVTIAQYPQSSNDCCSCDRTYNSYKSQSSKVLGWLQITLGLVFIVLQIAGMVIQNNRYNPNYVFYVGAAFWCSPFFIVAGALAVVSAQRQAGGPIVGNLVMSVLAAIMGIVFMSVTAAVVAEENGSNDYYYLGYTTRRQQDTGSYAISVVMLILSFVEIISTIWSSGLGCAVVCCGAPVNARNVRTTGTTIIPAVYYTNTQPTTYYGTPATVVQQGAVVYGNGPYPQQQQRAWVQPQPIIQQPPQYYPASAPPTYVEQQGPAEVHMPRPVDGTTQHPQHKY